MFTGRIFRKQAILSLHAVYLIDSIELTYSDNSRSNNARAFLLIFERHTLKTLYLSKLDALTTHAAQQLTVRLYT